MAENDTLRAARVYLACVAETPAPALVGLVAEVGPVAAAALVRAGDVPQDVVDETCARRDRVVLRDLDFGDPRRDIRLVIPEDDDWPTKQFQAMPHRPPGEGAPMAEPLALWIRGTQPMVHLLRQAVAITGSRSSSAYGEHVATELGYTLARQEITTVSGAAYGIDGAALRGALAGEGNTIAVMPCGVDVPYPAGHAELLRSVAQHGTIVSAYRPGSTPARHRYLVRNRIMTALSTMLVIPEAGLRSGALSAAYAAARIGRDVLAAPGPITSVTSLGTNQLLRDGVATAITTTQDVVDAVKDGSSKPCGTCQATRKTSAPDSSTCSSSTPGEVLGSDTPARQTDSAPS
ncbi:DNA-processing protein DprA [Lentzea sp. NBRC 105346]|uniref:DNA-processing protein DprA n=1 Tax=Lentzea sp. NBRC 105346 TaxID=3032205 RepID=UPI002556C8E3|nr:DNA-processing protein DprA [Lentzea sp. NBRC 105346]